jgi:large subunit ribosomal protein L3
MPEKLSDTMIGGIVGRKLGMTQVYNGDRKLVPVTVIQAGPCGVTQIKTLERDGYAAVQIGFEEVSERKLSKPQLGHLRSQGARLWRYLREFTQLQECKVGDLIKVDIFSKGDKISVQGMSKGKGFQGVIKRHNYGGGPASHGSMFHRAPGSIGNSSFPSRVWKNKALPGQMGHDRIKIQGLQIVDVRPEENLLLVSGSVPGEIGSLVMVRKA